MSESAAMVNEVRDLLVSAAHAYNEARGIAESITSPKHRKEARELVAGFVESLE